jgi:hypothetical protein
MTKITTDFIGNENATVRASRRKDIHDFWFGAGTATALGTFAGVRSNINTIYDPDVVNEEAFASWLTKFNALNEPDKLLNDTLKDANPAAFVLADDTARIFGPDGVTAVSAPGTAVSLAADDWEGLELGAQVLVNGSFAADTDWNKGADWTISGGQALYSAGSGSNLTASVGPLTNGVFYLVEIDVASISGTFGVRVGAVNLTDYSVSSAGVNRTVIVSDGVDFVLRGNSGAVIAINSVSVREVLNWPAYQNTAAARPTWGRAPKEVRNLLTATEEFDNAAWAKTNVTVSQVAGEVWEVNEGVATGNHVINQVPFIEAQQTGPGGFAIDVKAGSASPWVRLTSRNIFSSNFIDFNLADQTQVTNNDTFSSPVFNAQSLGDGWYRLSIRYTSVSNSVGGRPLALAILDASRNLSHTGTNRTILIRRPQVEAANAITPYQRRGATPTDVTESGVTSFGLISMDGSDDALLHQLAAGGTVSVALFGRGGSYLIPSITLAAPSVLQLGPLSVLDDGVVVSNSPTGILRAVGTVPWSSRFELVGYAIMKANPTAEEQARAMRYFAAFGARGWLVEGPELVTNGGFADATGWTVDAGWTIGSGIATKVASGSSASLTTSVSLSAGTFYVASFDVLTRTASNTVRIDFTGGTQVTGTNFPSGTGTFKEVLRAVTGNNAVRLIASTSDALTADNISVKALTPEF